MPNALIVSTARTPIARSRKGSLIDCRPDDLGVTAIRGVLSTVEQLPADSADDIVVGCAQPSREHGHNLGRVITVLLGPENVPGVPVNRFYSSSRLS